jgi:uncharacterized Zn finger protein (UPF0148 family)
MDCETCGKPMFRYRDGNSDSYVCIPCEEGVPDEADLT